MRESVAEKTILQASNGDFQYSLNSIVDLPISVLDIHSLKIFPKDYRSRCQGVYLTDLLTQVDRWSIASTGEVLLYCFYSKDKR
jgi:hypothetical protein